MVSTRTLATLATISFATALPLQEASLEKRVDCLDLGSIVISYVNDISTIAASGVSLGLTIASLVVNIIGSFIPGNIISGGAAALSIVGIVDSSLGLAYGITATAAAIPFGCFNGSPLTKRDNDLSGESKEVAKAVEKGIHGGTELAQNLIKLQNAIGGNSTDNNIDQISSKGKVIVSGLLNSTKQATDQWSALSDQYGSNVTNLESLYSQLW